MTKKKYTQMQLEELYARACAHPYPDDYDPDFPKNKYHVDWKAEREWYEKRGLKGYVEDNAPLTRWEHTAGWTEAEKFNPVRIISPKNASYPDAALALMLITE